MAILRCGLFYGAVSSQKNISQFYVATELFHSKRFRRNLYKIIIYEAKNTRQRIN
jgi:hypothetical protein